MADIIIKSLSELKDIVIENLREGTVVSIELSGEEEGEDGESD